MLVAVLLLLVIAAPAQAGTLRIHIPPNSTATATGALSAHHEGVVSARVNRHRFPYGEIRNGTAWFYGHGLVVRVTDRRRLVVRASSARHRAVTVVVRWH